MAALLNVKQFVRFDEHGNLNVPNKLFVACQAYVQTPLLGDNSSRVATTEWVRAQLTNVTGISFSETDPIWASDKTYYYTKLQSDARYLQSFTETDPTVPAWAKTSVKPTYTFAELLSKPTTIAGYGITDIPTTLPASDVYAWAKAATKPSYAYSEITGLPTLFSGSYTDLTNKPTIPTYTLSGLGGQPLDADLTAIAALAGTAGFLKKTAADTWALDNSTYLTSYTETDPIWTAEKTNYALKTYVDTSISNLVASAPATLNTLNELALALGSDANFATTVSTSIGNRVPYTGATGNVNLGNNSLSLGTAGTAGSTISLLGTLNDYISVGTVGCQVQILPASIKLIDNQAGGSLTLFLRAAGLTTGVNRTILFPNADGTVALTSNLSNYVTLDTAQVITGSKIFGSSVSIITGGQASLSVLSSTGNSALILGYVNNVLKGTIDISATEFKLISAIDNILKFQSSTNFRASLIFSNSADYNYTFPAASGTLALTSQIPSTTGFVPYTGATGSLYLGNNDVETRFVMIEGDGTQGGILSFKQYASSWQSTTNHTNIYATGTNKLNFSFFQTGGGGKFFNFDVSSLSSTGRTYTMPDANGTLALTSNLSSYVPTSRIITINGTAYNLSEDRAWTITTASAYTLPTASATVLGGIKVGSNLSIDANGVLSSTDTNTTYSVFTGATALANGTAGLVIAPLIANRAQYLKGDGTWGTPPDTDTTYVAFTRSAAGLAPASGGTSGTTKYLREDGTWAVPPDTDTDTNTVTQIRRENADGTTAATAYRTGDIRLRQGTNVTITEVAAGVFQISSSYVDTDTNTWDANSKTVAGYVAAPGDVANKVWKTDGSGNPGWRNDADTDTTYSAGTGLTLTGTSFSITKTITAAQTADTIALRNGDGQLVATGFYQASSRSLKTNISPFTKSALDIIRDVTVVSFNYKTDIINKHVGFIAEDTPEELSTRHKNVMDSNNTIGVLLKAVQELEARIKQLESK